MSFRYAEGGEKSYTACLSFMQSGNAVTFKFSLRLRRIEMTFFSIDLMLIYFMAEYEVPFI